MCVCVCVRVCVRACVRAWVCNRILFLLNLFVLHYFREFMLKVLVYITLPKSGGDPNGVVHKEKHLVNMHRSLNLTNLHEVKREIV